MIEVKEVFNTENEREFISKEFLRSNALNRINDSAWELAKDIQKRLLIAEDSFHSLNGMVYGFAYLDIITLDEASRFMDAVIRAKYEFGGFCAHIYPCGLVTLKYIGG